MMKIQNKNIIAPYSLPALLNRAKVQYEKINENRTSKEIRPYVIIIIIVM